MPIFKLAANITVSACTDVDADTLAEAIAIAQERSVVMSTGHDGYGASEYWIVEEADGEPAGIKEV